MTENNIPYAETATKRLMIIKPYRVSRGRVSAQVLIDITNAMTMAEDNAEALSCVRAIISNVNFGLKAKP